MAGTSLTRYAAPGKPPLTCRRMPLADGDAGIARTVKLMQQIVAGNEGAAHPQIRATALQIIKDVPSNDKAGERNAIFQWLKNNLKFRGEYEETLQTPLVTMQLKAGDCDDHSTLMAALLQSIGHNTAFKTIATGGRDYSHVYVLDYDRASRAWVPLDTTVAASFPGWEAPNATRSKVWGGLQGPRPLRGLAGMGDDTSDTITSIAGDLQPLVNAAAIRLAYGPNAGYQPFTQNLSPQSAPGMPNWVPWAAGFGFLALVVSSLKGRR